MGKVSWADFKGKQCSNPGLFAIRAEFKGV